MTKFRLSGASLNLTPMDWSGNRRTIAAVLSLAAERRVGICCLPELCVSGYGCEDMFLSAGLRETASVVVSELLPLTRGMIVVLGVPVEVEGKNYNAALVVCDRQIVGLVPKQFLAGDGIHYEPRWFAPWERGRVETINYAGYECPIGDLLFQCGDVKFGIEVCRDAWVADRPGKQLADRGAELILNPSASHFAFGKQQLRDKFVMEATRDLGLTYAYVNLLGNEAGRALYDGGVMLASGGQIRVRGPRFSFADFSFASLPIELTGSRRPQRDADMGEVVKIPFELPHAAAGAEAEMVTGIARDDGDYRLHDHLPVGYEMTESTEAQRKKREEFSRAVPLALCDYLRKSRARAAVLSLSGGADSTATALLVWLAVELGCRELGDASLIARMTPHLAGQEPPRAEWFRQLLVCVYQSTRNSGEVTRSAAAKVANSLGAEFLQWSVDAHVEAYVETVEEAIGRELTWASDDIALQNIQARSRAPGVWLLANLRQALLLTTSNRSEAAVGYATMDGDTCGGLAPIAGIDKAFLREWLGWMEVEGVAGLQPLEFLKVVNDQAPTAELRPADAAQTDEGDLMPYQVLDAVERSAIRDKLMPLDVYAELAEQFPEYDEEQLVTWVERFFRLWCRNQWKRERYAPSFHLDDENLDPRSWCRFPILNGGYERELQSLRQRLGRV